MSKSFAVPQFAQSVVRSFKVRPACGRTVLIAAISCRFAWVARGLAQVASQATNSKVAIIHARTSGHLLLLAVEQTRLPG
jgi:hypothetical protein